MNSQRYISNPNMSNKVQSNDQTKQIANQIQIMPLIAFGYDIPKNEGITNKELTTLFSEMNLICQVQVINEESKPYLSARIKFEDESSFKLGLEKLRYFKIRGKCCRVMGFEPLLERNGGRLQLGNSKNQQNLTNDQLLQQIMSGTENMIMPDNCFAECNLFVKLIDQSFDSQDLYNYFKRYGMVKSAKISMKPENHESRGYGFVWFASEEATHKALNDSKSSIIPFTCVLYQPRSLDESLQKQQKCIIVKNIPPQFTAKDLYSLFEGFGNIDYCDFICNKQQVNAKDRLGLIAFENADSARFALTLNKITLSETNEKLYVQTAIPERVVDSLKHMVVKQHTDSIVLFVSNIPKSMDSIQLRKRLGEFGKIHKFKHVIKEKYTKSVAFLTYYLPENADRAYRQKYIVHDDTQIYISLAKSHTKDDKLIQGFISDGKSIGEELKAMDSLSSKQQSEKQSHKKEMQIKPAIVYTRPFNSKDILPKARPHHFVEGFNPSPHQSLVQNIKDVKEIQNLQQCPIGFPELTKASSLMNNLQILADFQAVNQSTQNLKISNAVPPKNSNNRTPIMTTPSKTDNSLRSPSLQASCESSKLKDLADVIQKKIEHEASFNEESKEAILERSFDNFKKPQAQLNSDSKNGKGYCIMNKNYQENICFNTLSSKSLRSGFLKISSSETNENKSGCVVKEKIRKPLQQLNVQDVYNRQAKVSNKSDKIDIYNVTPFKPYESNYFDNLFNKKDEKVYIVKASLSKKETVEIKCIEQFKKISANFAEQEFPLLYDAVKQFAIHYAEKKQLENEDESEKESVTYNVEMFAEHLVKIVKKTPLNQLRDWVCEYDAFEMLAYKEFLKSESVISILSTSVKDFSADKSSQGKNDEITDNQVSSFI